MNTDQIIKKLEWLDEERRKDKTTIATLTERIHSLEGSLDISTQQIKGLTTEIARLGAMQSRLDQFDEALLQIRVETKRKDDELEKQFRKSMEESEKVRRVEMRAIDVDLAAVRKQLEPIAELKRGLQARVDSEMRIDRLIAETQQKIDDVNHSTEEYSRSYRLAEESRRQESKRLTDVQGEITALRKRVDEQRAQLELHGNNQRKTDARLSELASVENERKEAQAAFMEQQSLMQVERDRSWKEWIARLEVIERQSSEVEAQMQAMESTHQLVKRSQETLGSLAERVERRINEITEIQRLGEERFRQEWVTFKGDDQKRWTNYTLSQEEQRSEIVRQAEKLAQRVTELEDQLQEDQDILRQMNEQTEKRLQSLLAMAHEWVNAYERVLGQLR
jgi:hypothetical protein